LIFEFESNILLEQLYYMYYNVRSKSAQNGGHHSVLSLFKSFKLNVCHHTLLVTIVQKHGFFISSITSKMIVESNPFVWNDYLCLISIKSKLSMLILEKKTSYLVKMNIMVNMWCMWHPNRGVWFD